MAVVGDQRRALVVEQVEAARHGLGVADEGREAGLDVVPGQVQRPGRTDGSQRVLDLEADRTIGGDRHPRQRDARLLPACGGDDVTLVDEQHPLAQGAMGGDHRVVRVVAEIGDLAWAMAGHLDDFGVGAIEHGHAAGRDVEHDHALEHAQVLERGDEVQPQVVASADVGHDRHLAAVIGQAFAQQAAARGLEHGRIDIGVHQHIAGAARAAAVAAVGLAAVDVDAVGVGHAHAQAIALEQVGGQAHGGGLAVGAGDRDDRNAAVVAIRVHVVDDRFAHIAALAKARAQVHAQTRGGVDLDHATGLQLERLDHVLADDVDAADVQAHHLGGGHRARGHIGVDFVGHVGGAAAGREVGVVAQHDALAQHRHRFGGQVLLAQAVERNVVEPDLGQRRGMAIAALGVLVDDLDQFAHGVRSVADHQRRIAARGGHQLVTDHQEAVVDAGQEALDQDFLAVMARIAVAGHDLFARLDVDGHALALVAVERLDHDRPAEFLRCQPGVFLVLDRAAQRHRHASRVQQLLGQVLVLGDAFGDRAGAVDLGGLDAALLAAPAELDQAALGQATVGNAACDCGVDDGAGRRAESHVLVGLAQASDGLDQVERLFFQRGFDQFDREIKRHAADLFLGVFDHDLIDPRIGRLRSAAEADLAAGLGLQRQRRALEHMGQRQPDLGAGLLQGADLREALAQVLDEAGQLGQIALRGRERDDGLDRGVAGPEVGAAQGPDAGNFHLA